MDTMPGITGGVDTHLDLHVAAALDDTGRLLGTRSFPTTPAGYRALLTWLQQFGDVVKVGVEGTGSYGAGLARYLAEHGITVVEVSRPNRVKRRQQGKSDSLDAVNAARAALSGEASALPKSTTGDVECIRVLRLVQGSARGERTQTINQMRSIVSTAPAELRERLRNLTVTQLVRTAAALRPGSSTDPSTVTKLALRALARRVQNLNSELTEITRVLGPLVTSTAPKMVGQYAVGPDTAGALLVTAGDNNRRVRSDAAYARMLGSAPRPFPPAAARPTADTGCTAAVTDKATRRCGGSSWCAWPATHAPRPTSNDASKKACPRRRSCAASSGRSPASSTPAYPTNSPLDGTRSIAYGRAEVADMSLPSCRSPRRSRTHRVAATTAVQKATWSSASASVGLGHIRPMAAMGAATITILSSRLTGHAYLLRKEPRSDESLA
jgi:transposase